MSHSMNREFVLLHVSVRMEWQKDFSNFPGCDSPTDRGLAGPTYQVAGSLSHPEKQSSIHCNAMNVLQCLVILQIQFTLYSEHSSHPLLSVAGCQLLSHNTHILALIRCSHIKFYFDNLQKFHPERKGLDGGWWGHFGSVWCVLDGFGRLGWIQFGFFVWVKGLAICL